MASDALNAVLYAYENVGKPVPADALTAILYAYENVGIGKFNWFVEWVHFATRGPNYAVLYAYENVS